jgi:hypothetical protein
MLDQHVSIIISAVVAVVVAAVFVIDMLPTILLS